MNNFILTFDILRTSEELEQLNGLLGEKNFCPVGVNCHAYLIRFDGTAADLREYLKTAGAVYPYEDFFIAEVKQWSAALRGRQRQDVPTFLGMHEDIRSANMAFA